jgi:hypothetical protein
MWVGFASAVAPEAGRAVIAPTPRAATHGARRRRAANKKAMLRVVLIVVWVFSSDGCCGVGEKKAGRQDSVSGRSTPREWENSVEHPKEESGPE